MLIMGLLDLIKGMLDVLFSLFSIPSMPANVMNYVDQAMVYMEAGSAVLNNYIDLHWISILFHAFVSIWLALEVYRFIMWVIRKIPLLNIK